MKTFLTLTLLYSLFGTYACTTKNHSMSSVAHDPAREPQNSGTQHTVADSGPGAPALGGNDGRTNESMSAAKGMGHNSKNASNETPFPTPTPTQ